MAAGLRRRLAGLLAAEPAAGEGGPLRARFERRVQALLSATAAPAGGLPEDGFVMQGPVSEDTETALACLRKLYAREMVVLSTWKNSPPALLERLSASCDAVVLSAPPALAGGSNRNFQIASTVAGLARARELGVGTVLKLRTDTCLLAPDLFAQYRHAEGRIGHGAASAAGLARRIFVPQTYTKKYFPFHVSDIVMLGDLADLSRFWNVPLDERALAPEDFSWGRQALERIGAEGLLPECYLGRRFAASVGLAGSGDLLADWWRLLRDYFVVVEDGWFDLYWMKRPVHLQHRAVDELVSHGFWQSLYAGLPPSLPVWEAELAAARREGATFAYERPPLLGAAGDAA